MLGYTLAQLSDPQASLGSPWPQFVNSTGDLSDHSWPPAVFRRLSPSQESPSYRYISCTVGSGEVGRCEGGHLGHDEGVLLRAVYRHQVPAQPRAVGPRLPPAQTRLVVGVRGTEGENEE